MSKIVSRLLIFFVGLPLVVLLVITDFLNFLPLHIGLIYVSGVAAHETYEMLKSRLLVQPKILVLVLTIFIPISACIMVFSGLSSGLIAYIFTLSFMLCTMWEVFTIHKTDSDVFADSISHICSTVFVLMYAGFLITYMSRMTAWQYAKENLALVIVMVYGCDSIAWFLGMTLGKSNRGVVAVSPNKSIAGFIGGYIGSITAGLIAWYIFPHVFTGSVIKMLVLSILVATAAIQGDLAESVLKRSGHIKDSGHVIPGRGGMMDSVDSLFMAAPVYYFVSTLLYSFR